LRVIVAAMACEDCARRESVEILEELDYAERVRRNQGKMIVALIVIVTLVIIRLDAKGALTFTELLEGIESG
jgi:hypothetical protein